MGKQISLEQKVEYFHRLIEPYTKTHGGKRFFVDQYLRGAGDELKEHFWDEKSSSRLAFDLYSCMKDDDNVLDLEFEFQLPPLASGGMGPNMDVYIETEDELIFIESKFTESANLNYINKEHLENSYLSKAYYAETHGRNNMELSKRFHNYQWASSFKDFCYSFEDEMTNNGWHKGHDWFEPKQETCHLLGILFYIFDPKNHDKVKGKKIRLYNIYWNMPDDLPHSPMEEKFHHMANNLIASIMSDGYPNNVIDFTFNTFSIQEMLNSNSLLSDHISFPPTRKDDIITRNQKIVGNLTRIQAKNL